MPAYVRAVLQIEGTGKGLRHVKVKLVEDARRPGLAQLIREATRLGQRG